jgi:hypothetical protein
VNNWSNTMRNTSVDPTIADNRETEDREVSATSSAEDLIPPTTAGNTPRTSRSANDRIHFHNEIHSQPTKRSNGSVDLFASVPTVKKNLTPVLVTSLD